MENERRGAYRSTLHICRISSSRSTDSSPLHSRHRLSHEHATQRAICGRDVEEGFRDHGRNEAVGRMHRMESGGRAFDSLSTVGIKDTSCFDFATHAASWRRSWLRSA